MINIETIESENACFPQFLLFYRHI